MKSVETIRSRVLRNDPTVSHEFCVVWLQEVSRTFALNIKVLPSRLEEPVRLAYLFCRIADTIEDDRDMPPAQRQHLLELFIECFQSKLSPITIENFVTSIPKSWLDSQEADKFLTAHSRLVFEIYAKVPEPARVPIEERVLEMCRGMIHYAVQREEDGWFSLQTRRELLDYCYYVAGTVGLMLTDLWAWHHPLLTKKRYEALRARSVAFGLGLQLVNISRDIPADWKRKTVFVPKELCQAQGIIPAQMTDPDSRVPSMLVLQDMMRMAQKELLESQKYVLTLPIWALRVRLFCLWPLLMAQDSLIALAQSGNDALDPHKRVKIGRKQVKKILFVTTLFCGSNTLLKILFRNRNAQLKTLLGES